MDTIKMQRGLITELSWEVKIRQKMRMSNQEDE